MKIAYVVTESANFLPSPLALDYHYLLFGSSANEQQRIVNIDEKYLIIGKLAKMLYLLRLNDLTFF